MGETTFYNDLARRKYPPEVREEIARMALANALNFIITRGNKSGMYPITKELFPVMGADYHVRFGHEFSTGAGYAAKLVDLQPRPNIDDLVTRLPPNFARLLRIKR